MQLPLPAPKRTFALYIGLAALLYIALFWHLGTPTFWDPDEAHYAQTTREMILTGDWLAAYYNQEPFFDKPVLFHWLQGVPMALVGPVEGAARLTPALAGVALVGITGWLGTVLAGGRVGLLAALILAANPGLFGLARYAILDTVFTAFLFGGVSMVAVSALCGRPRLQYGGYVLIALATFTKGPLAPVLCGLAFGLSLFSDGARNKLLTLRWIVGVLIVVLVAGPWFVYMLARFGRSFIDGYFLNENVLLFSAPPYGNQPPWWFYFSILAVGMLPWTGVALGRAFDQISGTATGRRRIDTFEVLLWSWVAAVVGFFTLSQFKLDHYVFPAAPALAILCARGWLDARTGEASSMNMGARFGARMVGPLLIVAGLAGAAIGVARLDLPAVAGIVPGAMILFGTVLVVQEFGTRFRAPDFPSVVFVVFAITYAGAVIWVMPVLESGKVVPDVARWVADRASPSDRIATFQLNRWNPAYRYYVERHTEFLQNDEDTKRFFSDPSPYYCVMTRPLYDALRAAGVPLQVVYRRQGFWATSGRSLWRSKPERTEFVVTTSVAAPAR